MSHNPFDKLLSLLRELEQKGVSYQLAHHRDEGLMVIAAVPGERWEIEFLTDGSVEVERFTSNGDIHGEAILNDLLARYAEPAPDSPEMSRDVNVGIN